MVFFFCVIDHELNGLKPCLVNVVTREVERTEQYHRERFDFISVHR